MFKGFNDRFFLLLRRPWRPAVLTLCQIIILPFDDTALPLRPLGLTEGEMLVKVLKIKDFYEFNFCSNTIVSMWLVIEKLS